MSIVRKLIKMKLASRAMNAVQHVHCGLLETLARLMHPREWQDDVEDCIQLLNEKCTKTPLIAPFYSETVVSGAYDHVTRFLDAALILGDCNTRALASRTRAAHLQNVVWKAASVM